MLIFQHFRNRGQAKRPNLLHLILTAYVIQLSSGNSRHPATYSDWTLLPRRKDTSWLCHSLHKLMKSLPGLSPALIKIKQISSTNPASTLRTAKGTTKSRKLFVGLNNQANTEVNLWTFCMADLGPYSRHWPYCSTLDPWSPFHTDIRTSMLLRVLNSIRSWSLLKASLGYWKLKVENGVFGSSKMSKSAKSFSSWVSLGTPACRTHTKTQLDVRSDDLFLNALLRPQTTADRLKGYFRDRTFLVHNGHVVIKLQRNSQMQHQNLCAHLAICISGSWCWPKQNGL